MQIRAPLFHVPSRSLCGLGISDFINNPDVNSSGSMLEGRFGAVTVTCEVPGFDDPCLSAGEASDEGCDNPVFASFEATLSTSDVESGYNHLSFVLSRISYDSTVSVATGWSGSLSLDRGAAILRVVRPTESHQDLCFHDAGRTVLGWASRTSVNYDGITIDIVVSKPKPVLDTSTNVDITCDGKLTSTVSTEIAYASAEPVDTKVDTGPRCSTFTLEEISALDIFSGLYGKVLSPSYLCLYLISPAGPNPAGEAYRRRWC